MDTPIIILIVTLIVGIGGSTFWLQKSFRTAPWLPLSSNYRPILQRHVKYYRLLDKPHQKRFEGRCQVFINLSSFKAAGFSYVSDEMKILIAAAYVQFTFGWNKPPRPRFKQIWIYPDSFYEPIFKEQYLWVRERPDTLELSWEKFLRGFKESDIKGNAGLHHLFLCLPLEKIMINEQKPQVIKVIREWRNHIQQLVHDPLLSRASIFRWNPQINPRELEAQVLENFFERPDDLQQFNPELYQLLEVILKQHPIKTSA